MHENQSTNHFLKKLTERDKQITTQLYSNKGKENVNSQVGPKPPNKNRRIKTECSIDLVNIQQPDKNWYFDCRKIEQNNNPHFSILNNWFCLSSGIVQFNKIIGQPSFEDQISQIVRQKNFLSEQSFKSITLQIWLTGESEKNSSLMEALLEYSLPFLKYGKGVWSVAAITANKKYDLLSLDSQGCTLWKGKTPLSKVQLEREPLMRRVFGFGAEKEKTLQYHQTLAKLQFSNNSRVYFILRNASTSNEPGLNTPLLISQEIILEDVTPLPSVSILRPGKDISQGQLREILQRLKLKIKREQELSKQERQRFLKCMIEKLQGELSGKQQQLKLYKSQHQQVPEVDQQEDFGIPSERISMKQQRYQQLKRHIKDPSRV